MSPPKTIHLLSGGAAQGLVTQLKSRFEEADQCVLDGQFGAVGAMLDRLVAGVPCDAVILTHSLIDQLADLGHVVPGSARPLGIVKTGVAVKNGAPAPKVDTTSALKEALLAATGIYFPDPVRATAGIHFMKVLQELGLGEELADRLRPFPNGATAMREMAESADAGVIGCTQVTEILYTAGVQLVAPLPNEFELATVYTAAVCAKAGHPKTAAVLIGLLGSKDTEGLRKAAGFA